MGKLKLCVLDNCSTNSYLTKPRDVKLHRFPVDLSLKSKWEKWIRDVGGPNCKDFVATKSTHTVCAKHFKPSDYLNIKLGYQAVPSIPPESETSSKTIESSSPMNTYFPPTSSQTETKMPIITSVSSLKPVMSPQMLQIASQQIPILGTPPSNFIHFPVSVRVQAIADQKNQSSAYTVTVVKVDKNTGTFTQTPCVESSSNPASLLRSPVNGHPVQADETSQQPGKSRPHARDSNQAGFLCPVRAQRSLNTAADEIERTKRKVDTMRLKYIRTTRKIKTLMDILKQLKDESDSLDDNEEIKVCSSCRKVNVCQ